MAAGLGFKDFTTGEVLTAADVDGYLMQGIWVFANATARDAAVTSPQEGNFAFLKDTNTTTYYTGSAWTNLDTTGMVNPMTTTGDTIYSSSGSTPARLGIGTAGQVLQVNSGATAPEWATPAGSAGALTLISTTTIGTTVASVTVSSAFSATYDNYLINLNLETASAASEIYMTLGATATGYYGNVIYQAPNSGTVNGLAQNNVNSMLVSYYSTDGGNSEIYVANPNKAKKTVVLSNGSGFATAANTTSRANYHVANTTAYTAFTLTPGAGTLTGGEIRVYGYQN
jgi:hypothetical protein